MRQSATERGGRLDPVWSGYPKFKDGANLFERGDQEDVIVVGGRPVRRRHRDTQ